MPEPCVKAKRRGGREQASRDSGVKRGASPGGARLRRRVGDGEEPSGRFGPGAFGVRRRDNALGGVAIDRRELLLIKGEVDCAAREAARRSQQRPKDAQRRDA